MLSSGVDLHKVLNEAQSLIWLSKSVQTLETREYDRLLCNGCRTGDLDMVKEAIKHGADPRVQFRLVLGEITPIFLCASKGYWKIAEFLIQENEEILHDTMGFDGTTCLHHAASNNQPGMCELLIKHGCLVDRQDKLGRTALMDAAEIGSVKVISVLSENKANLDEEDKEGHTAVSYALDFISKDAGKFFDAAHCLIEKGANPDYAGKFTNRTLLHHCAAQGELEFTKKLVEQYNANPLQVDDGGKLPIDYARENQHDDVVEYFKSRMPDQQSCQCSIM